mgnify:CR=1 FL=1
MEQSKTARAGAGFSLIELMIAMAITAIVLAALIEVFSAQQQMYNQQSSLARAQANSRAALSIVSREVRMAGYTGLPEGMARLNDAMTGSGPGSIYPVMSLKNGSATISGSPTGLAATSQALGLALNSISNTPDAFEIYGNFAREATGLSVTINAGETLTTITVPAAGLTLFGDTGFMRPAFVVVGNNTRAEIFPFVSASASGANVDLTVTGTANMEFRANNVPGGESNVVLPLFRRVYYVDTTNVTNAQGEVVPTLFVANYQADGTLAGEPVELAQGVEDLQVSYDLRNNLNQTLTQDMITDPCAVMSVRILMRNTGWQTEDADFPRELVSVVRIRNAGLGITTCPVL